MAAATTAGAAAARQAFTKARSTRGDGGSDGSAGRDAASSALDGAWRAAREHLLPAAEQAAGALGRYLAKDAPELLRDVLVPQVVQGFQEARSEGSAPRGETAAPGERPPEARAA